MATIIIAEKPDAAKHIANALADKKPEKLQSEHGVDYYSFTRNNKRYFVVAAVGHLFGLKQVGKGWDYPNFNLEWLPAFKIRATSAFSKKYYDTLMELKKKGNKYIIACDYDNEGSLIGYNILRFIFGTEKAGRMKFSTLAKPDLIKSFETMDKKIDMQNVEAGLARHYLDYYYGVNVTRALTLAIKKYAKRFSMLSAGRVQGPTLVLLAKKEKEIQKFKPKPYWQIELKVNIGKNIITALYEKEKIFDKKKADNVYKQSKTKKEAIVEKITKKTYEQKPPVPFNITTLQTEAYKLFGYSPRQTLNIAQDLYTKAYISYPRTSSEKLPASINNRAILEALSRTKKYEKICKKILAGTCKPNEGKRTDPAHEAIHPTVQPPKRPLSGPRQKIYDLICRRYMAVFGSNAKRESMKIELKVGKHKFFTTGRRTVEKGWMEYYGPYAKHDESVFPDLKKGDKLKIKKLDLLTKQTSPPPRYSQASIIREMEKKSLGTRCLTGDTSLKILNSGTLKDIRISDLFDNCKKINVNDGNTELSLNKNIHCISMIGEDLVNEKFILASRRPLKKNEKVFEIKFSDNTTIKSTEEHPICVFDDGIIKYKLTKDLKEGDKSVSVFNNYDITGKNTITWNDFVNMCDRSERIYGLIDIKNYRRNKHLTQRQLAKLLNTEQSVISSWEKRKHVPIWVWKYLDLQNPDKLIGINKNFIINNPFPIKSSSKLARIFANLIGDGSLDREKVKRENAYDVRYVNSDMNLLFEFRKNIKDVFKLKRSFCIKPDKRVSKTTGKFTRYYLRLPSLIGKIIFLCFPELFNKNVPKFLERDLYPYFIGALFDDEGHVFRNSPKMFISNTNKTLLERISTMLKSFDINAKLIKESNKNRKKNWSDSYKLFIRGRLNLQKFMENIPFIHEKKKKRLLNHFSRFYKYGTLKSQFEKEKLVAVALNNNDFTKTEIVKVTGLTRSEVTTALKNLRKYNYVKLYTKGKSEQPKKIILYKLIKPIEKTIYSIINENIINGKLFTKKIKSVNKIDYNGFVYDITKDKYHNFVLSNGVISHNSTRAQILQTLYDRDYIVNKSIRVTKLGMKIAEVIQKYVPDLADEKLTRKFEKDIEKIQQGKEKKEKILRKARQIVTKISNEFKKAESKIGKSLSDAIVTTQDEKITLGTCPVCGGELKILYSPFSKKKFVGCSGYNRCAVCGFTKKACKCKCPICGKEKGKCKCSWKDKKWTPKCTVGFPLPHNAKIQKLNKVCEKCNTPIIRIIRQGKRPFNMCLDPKCETKKEWGKPKKKKTKKSTKRKV
ncbi:MAG: DNA topoisomerase I [Candidatus Aenigmarchaeota archaeon]|nr:DNA topoisomerase I [Candidatus Aenigmarchaeota archaeon]